MQEVCYFVARLFNEAQQHPLDDKHLCTHPSSCCSSLLLKKKLPQRPVIVLLSFLFPKSWVVVLHLLTNCLCSFQPSLFSQLCVLDMHLLITCIPPLHGLAFVNLFSQPVPFFASPLTLSTCCALFSFNCFALCVSNHDANVSSSSFLLSTFPVALPKLFDCSLFGDCCTDICSSFVMGKQPESSASL